MISQRLISTPTYTESGGTLERICEGGEVVVFYSRQYPGACLAGVRNTAGKPQSGHSVSGPRCEHGNSRSRSATHYAVTITELDSSGSGRLYKLVETS
jgi:hypothetical protein